MNKYIQFPRYSIYLIPSKSFFDDLNIFYKKNNLEFNKLSQSFDYMHLTVKAPFYLSHLYSENDLINHFNSLDFNQFKKIFKKSYKIQKYSKSNKNLILELDSDPELFFLINDLMRSFDLYRKTLNNYEIKKDLLRFDNLTEKELTYYQIWGYPYYFDCTNHQISISNYYSNFKSHSFHPIKYCSLKLLKQANAEDMFNEISSISDLN